MINWIHDADLIYVNMSIKSNFIKPKDMNVGFSTVAAFVDLSKKDLVTKKKLLIFFLILFFFLLCLIEKMLESSPISYSIVRYASILHPKEMISV